MPDGPESPYDIFVSYAHVNDDPLPGVDTGWVSTFVAGFKRCLAEELGRRESVHLWMDYELRGHQSVTPAIHAQLASVKVLLLFLSKGYLASGWCMEELTTFVARHGPGSGRIFSVYLSPVDEIPEALRDLLQYRFWAEDETGEPRTFGDPLPSPVWDRDYYKGLRRLARDLARTLAGIPDRAPARNGRRVFVGGAAEDLTLVRSTAQALRGRGLACCLPLPATPGFDPASADPAELRRDLEEGLTGSDALVLLYRDGPLGQLRQTIREVEKLRARDDRVPARIDLCQPHPNADAIGLLTDTLNVIVTGHDCAADCAERVAARLLGAGAPAAGGAA